MSLALCNVLDSGSVLADQDNLTVRFRWRVPKPFKNTVSSNLQFSGHLVDENSRGWVVVFVGAALLTHLAESILRLHDELEGGTVIDTTGDEIFIERDRDLPMGTVLIVSEDGTRFVERKDLTNPADLAELIKGVK